MKIKKGDNIIVIAGKDKGKTAVVTKSLPKLNAVIIEGINMRKKHVKPTKQGQKGQVIEFAAPVNVSNVMLVIDGKKSKVGVKVVADKKVRLHKKTGKTA